MKIKKAAWDFTSGLILNLKFSLEGIKTSACDHLRSMAARKIGTENNEYTQRNILLKETAAIGKQKKAIMEMHLRYPLTCDGKHDKELKFLIKVKYFHVYFLSNKSVLIIFLLGNYWHQTGFRKSNCSKQLISRQFSRYLKPSNK